MALGMLAPGAAAQETRGSIRGRITDSSGAVVPNATVKATNIATNITVETRTNNDGDYTLPFLIPGSYNITAGAALGSKRLEKTISSCESTRDCNSISPWKWEPLRIRFR